MLNWVHVPAEVYKSLNTQTHLSRATVSKYDLYIKISTDALGSRMENWCERPIKLKVSNKSCPCCHLAISATPGTWVRTVSAVPVMPVKIYEAALHASIWNNC